MIAVLETKKLVGLLIRSILIKITSIMASWKFFLDFTTNKIAADIGCVHMLIYNTPLWRKLHAWCSYNELRFKNHSGFLNMAILYYYECDIVQHLFLKVW